MRLLLAALIALTVRWIAPDVARVAWDGPGCLYKGATLIACYPRQAGYTIELGSYPGLDAAYRPAPNDVFTIVRPDGTSERATLGARPLYFPVFRR
jgi:hypothetical protein